MAKYSIDEKIYRDVFFLGDFNPTIFQPKWLLSEALINEGEKNAANINVIHPDITDFSLDWCNINVTRRRFVAITQDELYDSTFRDLIISIFKLLSHTPITAMGLNYKIEYKFCDTDVYKSFIEKIFPLELSSSCEKDFSFNLLSFSEKKQDYNGALNIKIELLNNNKVLFDINDHYEVNNEKEISGCNEIMRIFEDEWDKSKTYVKTMIEIILERVIK